MDCMSILLIAGLLVLDHVAVVHHGSSQQVDHGLFPLAALGRLS